MRDPQTTEKARGCPIKSLSLRRLGAASFIFFLVKGLLWLGVGALGYIASTQ